jgi:hypothetical protein
VTTSPPMSRRASLAATASVSSGEAEVSFTLATLLNVRVSGALETPATL